MLFLVPKFLESELNEEKLKNIYWTTEKEQLEVAVKKKRESESCFTEAGRKKDVNEDFFFTKGYLSVRQEGVYKRANTDFTFEIQRTLLSPYVLQRKSKYLKAN